MYRFPGSPWHITCVEILWDRERNMQYRERAPRVDLSDDAVVHLGGEQIACRTANMSTSGLALICPVRRRVGGQVRVEFRLSQILWVTVQGQLVRHERRNGGYLWGVEFLEVDQWVEKYLKDYIEEQLSDNAVAV